LRFGTPPAWGGAALVSGGDATGLADAPTLCSGCGVGWREQPTAPSRPPKERRPNSARVRALDMVSSPRATRVPRPDRLLCARHAVAGPTSSRAVTSKRRMSRGVRPRQRLFCRAHTRIVALDDARDIAAMVPLDAIAGTVNGQTVQGAPQGFGAAASSEGTGAESASDLDAPRSRPTCRARCSRCSGELGVADREALPASRRSDRSTHRGRRRCRQNLAAV